MQPNRPFELPWVTRIILPQPLTSWQKASTPSLKVTQGKLLKCKLKEEQGEEGGVDVAIDLRVEPTIRITTAEVVGEVEGITLKDVVEELVTLHMYNHRIGQT
jgi:hypothetical protein